MPLDINIRSNQLTKMPTIIRRYRVTDIFQHNEISCKWTTLFWSCRIQRALVSAQEQNIWKNTQNGTGKSETFIPHANDLHSYGLNCVDTWIKVDHNRRVKVKVAHTRLPSVGFWSWSRFLAVSLQVMRVLNPAVGCHYFLPGLQFRNSVFDLTICCDTIYVGGSVAEWLSCWTQVPGFKSQPLQCLVTVLGKLFTPIVPLFTKQRNW